MFHHKSHAPIVVLCGVGIAVAATAACATLWYTYSPKAAQDRIIANTIPAVAEYKSQKDLIDAYVQNALAIENAYAAKQIPATEAKRRALALYVPGVLKDRHLAWVLALDKDDQKAAADATHDYQLLNLAQ